MCPHVIWDEEMKLFRMWYSGGEQYEPNAIGYATSPDGLPMRPSLTNGFPRDRQTGLPVAVEHPLA